MKKNTITGQGGFTLIETLMAMAIFTIGILGLFGMQTSSIKENLAANSISIGSSWAADQVETILARDYTELLRLDEGLNGDKDGCNGLSDWPAADWIIPPQSGVPIYRVYVNVARDCLLSAIPNAPLPAAVGEKTLEQKPLSIRIIVTVDKGSGEKESAIFNYIKQNSAKDV